MMSMIQECLDQAAKSQKDRSSGQLSFFDTGDTPEASILPFSRQGFRYQGVA